MPSWISHCKFHDTTIYMIIYVYIYNINIIDQYQYHGSIDQSRIYIYIDLIRLTCLSSRQVWLLWQDKREKGGGGATVVWFFKNLASNWSEASLSLVNHCELHVTGVINQIGSLLMILPIHVHIEFRSKFLAFFEQKGGCYEEFNFSVNMIS